MPRQYVNTQLAMIVCVCLCLMAYLSWLGQLEEEPGAAVADGASAAAAPAAPPAPAAPTEPVVSTPSAAAVELDVAAPESISVVVNKGRPLPAGYAPRDLVDAGGVQLRAEAAEAYRQLQIGAATANVAVSASSGFRAADEQARLHSSYLERYGSVVAESISARPGFSEHQTGLAVDIASPDGSCSLLPCFEGTPAGVWAAANAHQYGFIIRYPNGAEAITGYSYEPWHLRYIGVDLARRILDAGITLEEYAGLPAAPGY